MAILTRVEIKRLNDQFDVTVHFKGRHCIIVGPNGAGKSTALQIIAYALGRQWSALSKQRFEQISLFFGGRGVSVSRQACILHSEEQKIVPGAGKLLSSLEARGLFSQFLDADLSTRATASKFISPSFSLAELQRLQSALLVRKSVQPDNQHGGIRDVEVFFRDNEIPRVIFLPTSRRIEFDLSRITERMPDYVRSSIAEAFQNQSSGSYFEEIVRFGMEDIDAMLRSFEARTRDSSRARFNRMMSVLLKDMANEKPISVKDLREYNLDEGVIQGVLARIEDNVISQAEKKKISDILISLNSLGLGNPAFHKKWLAHFFFRLLEVNKNMARDEGPMQTFVDVLEKYLYPKQALYSIEKYRFSITSDGGVEIKLGELSSGEKQLVAIFAMLCFSESKAFVLIDEPELSLSAAWQTSFLLDLTRQNQCHQLISVTHSPFVFDNSLSSSVVDFQNCMQRSQDVFS